MRLLLPLLLACVALPSNASADEPLFSFPNWKQHRKSVEHPSLTIKKADVARAQENVKRYAWAKEYFESVTKRAAQDADRFTPEFLEKMLEPTTPLSTIFTPCPACRAQGKTWHPHGQWIWSDKDPDKLKCEICGTVFPGEQYPESVVLQTKWGTPQTLRFVGGEPFQVFSYKTGRPSISGCIRARKADYIYGECRTLGEAYLLDPDPRFARAVRTALLRLAKVYPHWLVHSGYGEFADMNPRVAAENINKLPEDELVYPPNVPDRMLHTGYWSAGRATGHGQESSFVRAIAFAYDATCEAKDAAGNAIYSDADRLNIERNVLLESTCLLTADKLINNKSVGNRTASAMVGLALGEPSLVHFGIDGFRKTVDGWFLPDGGTPESASYAIMAFSNTLDMPLASRGYSDPVGYVDPIDKSRLDAVNLYRSGAYAKAWSAMIDGLQGDLTFAPYADTRIGRKIDSQWADLLVAQYPERSQYLALLKALCGSDLHDATARFAIWYREPGLESKAAPKLTFPDICLPDLRIGHMRTGDDGRESLLLLSASRWGSHHHEDSLNIYYWKSGHELLTDLGYLWDNPKKHQAARTVAHNTVLIDEADQKTIERGGDVKFFVTSPHVKAMRATSKAYPDAKRYERTTAIIDHGDGKSYVADFFIVQGGKTQDYVFHGPHQTYATIRMSPQADSTPLYDFENIRRIDTDKNNPLRIDWTMDTKTIFSAWSVPQRDETIYLADGWGQRDPYNKDQGVTIPYIVRRTRGSSEMAFTSVFESHPPDAPLVKNVKRIHRGSKITLEVETTDGIDTIESVESGLRVTSRNRDKVNWEFTNAK